MTIWWCMAVVNHHKLFKNALKVVSFEFAGFALNSPDSPDRRIQGRIGKWCFRNPKNESEQILWLGWLLESAFGTADHREIAELLSHRRNTWFEFGVFSEKKTFFFEKFVIFLKNLSMGKSRKWHQKMFLRWNQKRSGFSNPFRPPGIVGEVSADTRNSKISIRRIRRFGGLNPPNRRIRRIESAESADWETAQKSHQFWLSELQK